MANRTEGMSVCVSVCHRVFASAVECHLYVCKCPVDWYPNFQIFSVWILDRKKMCSVLTEKLWSCGAETGRPNPLLSSVCK